MDAFLIALGGLLMILGIAGSILPILPGPPLSYVGLLIQQLREPGPYATDFLIIWALITVGITIIDYVIPIYGAKRMGGTKYGMWGCTIGLIVGMFFSPVGIIIGPFLGAFVGELIGNNNSQYAFRAALGSFLGFLLGTLLKLVATVAMAWYFIAPFFE